MHGQTRRRTNDGAMGATFARPSVGNRVIEAAYYRERAAEAAARKMVPKVKESLYAARREAIAKDLMTMTVAQVRAKHKAGYELVEDVRADMRLGKYKHLEEHSGT